MADRRFADKLGNMTSFKVVDFLDAAIRLESRGHDVVRMEAGQPVFPLPEPIARKLPGLCVPATNTYTAASGRADLRQALAGFIERRYSVEVDPRRILATTGSSAALGMICDLLLNPGDSLLLPDPGYPCNANFVRRSNGIPLFMPVGADRHYQPAARGLLHLRRHRQPCGGLRRILLADAGKGPRRLYPGHRLRQLSGPPARQVFLHRAHGAAGNGCRPPGQSPGGKT